MASKRRMSDAITRQIKASGGASCNKLEFALLAADLIDASEELAEARQDAERLRKLAVEMIADWRSEYPRMADQYQDKLEQIAARQKEEQK